MNRPIAALALCAAVIGIAALTGCAGSNEPPPSEPTFYQNMAQPDVTVDAAAAASMISGYRSNNGLGAVVVDPELMRFASDQAHAMAARDKMDHDAAKPFAERIRNAGLGGSVAVENISAGYHTLAEAFSGWRDSPPHRANMLNRSVARMGIAAVYAPNSKYKVFWALVLAGPAQAAAVHHW
jgi:uncharacterized protein YkwD